MENLVQRGVYDSDESGYLERLPWVMGTFFGLSMTVLFFILFTTMFAAQRDTSSVFLVCLVSGALGGVFFGLTFPRTFRRKMTAFTDAIYAGRSDLIDEPRADEGWRYRLPCSWMKTPRFAVGGVLYIGSGGVLFVPHRKNLKRDRVPIELGPPGDIQLSLLPPPPVGMVRRTLVPRPQKLLEIAAKSRRERFLIPQPESVIQIIQKRIIELCR